MMDCYGAEVVALSDQYLPPTQFDNFSRTYHPPFHLTAPDNFTIDNLQESESRELPDAIALLESIFVSPQFMKPQSSYMRLSLSKVGKRTTDPTS
jgi:hypothetical protein